MDTSKLGARPKAKPMQPTETDSDDSEDIPKTAADLVSDLKVALRPRHLQCLKLCQDGLHEKLMQTNRLHTYFGDDSDHGEPWPAGIPHAPKEQVARLLQEPRVQHYEPADAAEAKMLSLEEFLEEQKKRNIRKSPRFRTGGGKGAVGSVGYVQASPPGSGYVTATRTEPGPSRRLPPVPRPTSRRPTTERTTAPDLLADARPTESAHAPGYDSPGHDNAPEGATGSKSKRQEWSERNDGRKKPRGGQHKQWYSAKYVVTAQADV